jgi:hypothetical protein
VYRAESEMWVNESEEETTEIAANCIIRFRVMNVTFNSTTEMV